MAQSSTLLLIALVSWASMLHLSQGCFTVCGYGAFNSSVNVFPIVPSEEKSAPPYKHGVVFSTNLTESQSPYSRVVATYWGVKFVTERNCSIAHLSGHFSLPAFHAAGSCVVSFQGPIDLARGYGEYAVAGGTGPLSKSSGTVTERLVSGNYTDGVWYVSANIC